MPDDNSLLEFKYDKSWCRNVLTYFKSWVEPNVPELNTNTISTRCNWLKIRVCIAVRWRETLLARIQKGGKEECRTSATPTQDGGWLTVCCTRVKTERFKCRDLRTRKSRNRRRLTAEGVRVSLKNECQCPQ